MRTLALTVAYDGTDWAGFQRQAEYPSIQRELENALSEVLQHSVQLASAGRTDAGVHALGQVVSLQTWNPLPIARIPRVINRMLPASIRIRQAVERPAGFHARFSAVSRRYWYIIQPTRWIDPLRGRFSWQIEKALDVTAMLMALLPLAGRHDFAAFCRDGATARSTMRTLQRVSIHVSRERLIIDVQADAFLRQMVRLLVANVVLVGKGERPTSWLTELLGSCNRDLAGMGAPPHGLILMRVGYPRSLTIPPAGEGDGEDDDEEFSG